VILTLHIADRIDTWTDAEEKEMASIERLAQTQQRHHAFTQRDAHFGPGGDDVSVLSTQSVM
jgi:hypothetical protein